jgi:hypothetical protein
MRAVYGAILGPRRAAVNRRVAIVLSVGDEKHDPGKNFDPTPLYIPIYLHLITPAVQITDKTPTPHPCIYLSIHRLGVFFKITKYVKERKSAIQPFGQKRFKAGRIYGYQLLNGALIAGCDW